MEFKNSPQFTKSIDGRVVTGVCAVFGNVDHASDRLHPGAFSKTIAEGERRIKHLWNHGADGWDYFCTPPIANILELREISRNELPQAVTDKAPDATGGLLVRREYLQTPRGDEVLTNLKAGVPLEMSFGFDPIKWDWETVDSGQPTEYRLRNLREVRLWDTSDVNFGMNPATSAAGKSLDQRFQFLLERLKAIRAEVSDGARLPVSLVDELIILSGQLVPKPQLVDNQQQQKQPQLSSRAGQWSLTQAREALRELEMSVE